MCIKRILYWISDNGWYDIMESFKPFDCEQKVNHWYYIAILGTIGLYADEWIVLNWIIMHYSNIWNHLTVGKQMSSGLFGESYQLTFYKSYFSPLA